MSAVRPQAIHHVGLSVPDLDAATDFYCGVFGFEREDPFDWSGSPEIDSALGLEGSSGRGVMLRLGDVAIELFEFEEPRPRAADEPRAAGFGWTHICLVVEDARAMACMLKTHGVPMHAPPVNLGDGPFVYARDPFGNIIEIWEKVL
jgi:catechol 2,3-dioxygenase-like lactoylglutathione lyase family enzyme